MPFHLVSPDISRCQHRGIYHSKQINPQLWNRCRGALAHHAALAGSDVQYTDLVSNNQKDAGFA